MDITKKINNTTKFINEGQHILDNCILNSEEFNSNSSFLGSLPEIPELKEVPYLSFQFEPNIQSKLEELCSHFGTLNRIAPVQVFYYFQEIYIGDNQLLLGGAACSKHMYGVSVGITKLHLYVLSESLKTITST